MNELLKPPAEKNAPTSFLEKTWGVLTRTKKQRAQEKLVQRETTFRTLKNLQQDKNDPDYWAALVLAELENYRNHIDAGRIPTTKQYEVDGHTTQLEVVRISTHPDGRKDSERRSDEPHFVEFTGAWGSGPQNEVESLVLSQAMGADGVDISAISYPEHAGSTTTGKDGWKDPQAWEKTGKVIAHYLKELKQELGERPLILHGWSMGGTAIMEVLKHVEPGIIDGIVFADTPLKKEKFGKLVGRFGTYPVRAALLGIKEEIVRENGFDTQKYLVSPLGLKVFLDRLRDHRHPTKGIGFRVTWRSASQFAQKDYLENDVALEQLKKHGVPVLVLRPSNDWVVPKHQMSDLQATVRAFNAHMDQQSDRAPAYPLYGQAAKVEQTGHSLLEEQPEKMAAIIKLWLKSAVKDHRAKTAAAT